MGSGVCWVLRSQVTALPTSPSDGDTLPVFLTIKRMVTATVSTRQALSLPPNTNNRECEKSGLHLMAGGGDQHHDLPSLLHLAA